MKVKFSTTEFEFVHGKKPRGTGHWAFFFDCDWSKPVFFNGSFGDARKWAEAEAKAKGCHTVVVGA